MRKKEPRVFSRDKTRLYLRAVYAPRIVKRVHYQKVVCMSNTSHKIILRAYVVHGHGERHRFSVFF
jgi:hypothetical protein